jgi:isoleucyl-tRNA synthetase
MPLWVNDDFSEVVAIGSVQELKDLSGTTEDITDIHRDKYVSFCLLCQD